MLTTLKAKNFTGVPYLETSQLMTHHPNGMVFSLTKPNVVVGPNGAGKSALLTALSYLTLSNMTGVSALDSNYTGHTGLGETLWANDSRWGHDYRYLPGLEVATDYGPALYFRPGHIPGNDDSVAAAMMCGYFEQAKRYGNQTDEKSAGQQTLALQETVMAVLAGTQSVPSYTFMNWKMSKERVLAEDRYKRYSGPWEYQGDVLKERYLSVEATAVPMLLLDEPEQSLDALAETRLWRAIAGADVSRVQIVVATHSLYPLLHPERFHLIEAVPGYVDEVRAGIQ